MSILCNCDLHIRVAGVTFISLLSLFSNLIHEPWQALYEHVSNLSDTLLRIVAIVRMVKVLSTRP